MKYFGLIISVITGIFVGVVWVLSYDISVGEASCGAVITMIFVHSIYFWNYQFPKIMEEYNNEKK